MAAYRFLALVCPDDPHAREWVTESLQRAEEVGDRTAQVNSYNSLAWHHFMRSRLGWRGRHGRAAALPRPARRDRATSWACTRWRRTGSAWPPTWRASRGASTTPAGWPPRPSRWRVTEPPSHRARAGRGVLGRRAGAAIASEAPELDEHTVDPVSLMCAYLIGEQLILEGRADGTHRAMDAIDRRPGTSALEGVIGGFGKALSLVVVGRHAEARDDAEWAISAATALDAPLAETAGRALLAEVTLVVDGDRDAAARLLDEAPPVTGGLAHLLVLRARALLGDEAATRALQEGIDGAAHARSGARRAASA